MAARESKATKRYCSVYRFVRFVIDFRRPVALASIFVFVVPMLFTPRNSELSGVMVNTPAPHAAGPASIPGSGIFRRGQVVLLTRGVPRLPRGT